MGKPLSKSAATLGERGGRAGTGASKRRGDSAYYRELSARRRDRSSRAPGSGMRHRHLVHDSFTLAAIDDIIGNGAWDSWVRLRLAMARDAGIRGKILRVCGARALDPAEQRYRFWKLYAQEHAANS